MNASNSNAAPNTATPGPDHTISELRSALFAQLDRLKADPSATEIARARAVSDVAGRIIDSAKVEVEYVRVTGEAGTGFLAVADAKPALPPGMTQGVVHRLKG